MKKLVFVATIIVTLFGIVILFAFLSSIKQPKTNQPNNVNATPTIPQSDTLSLSGTPIKNFYKGAAKIDKQRDVYIIDEPNKYQIMYFEKFNNFMISITGSPFESLRQEAEKIFLEKTGMSQAAACQANVEITTPYYANPDFSGKSYPLSFCQQ